MSYSAYLYDDGRRTPGGSPFHQGQSAFLWDLTAGPSSVSTAPDGTITVTPATGPSETVTFNADGTITTTYGPPRSVAITTTFNPDGSITEVAT